MNCNIAVIKGDGIGPEVVTQAMKVLDAVGEKFGHTFNYEQLLMGGCSIDACGVPLTDEAVARAKASDAVLLGSIGGNTSTSPWYKLPPEKRPEAGLLKIRKELGLSRISRIEHFSWFLDLNMLKGYLMLHRLVVITSHA